VGVIESLPPWLQEVLFYYIETGILGWRRFFAELNIENFGRL